MGDAMNGLMRKVELEGSARSFASEGVRRCVVGQVQRARRRAKEERRQRQIPPHIATRKIEESRLYSESTATLYA